MFTDAELDDLEQRAVAELSTIPDEQLARARKWRSAGQAESAAPGIAGLHSIEVGDPASALLRFKRGDRSGAMNWAKEFLLRFVDEIRCHICTSGLGERASEAVGVTAKGAASALAAWLVSTFAISNPIAIGIAALVLIVIGSSLKGAFCGMSNQELARELRSA
jgi:hypothetical protein